jgi:hypothetical protein
MNQYGEEKWEELGRDGKQMIRRRPEGSCLEVDDDVDVRSTGLHI